MFQDELKAQTKGHSADLFRRMLKKQGLMLKRGLMHSGYTRTRMLGLKLQLLSLLYPHDI